MIFKIEEYPLDDKEIFKMSKEFSYTEIFQENTLDGIKFSFLTTIMYQNVRWTDDTNETLSTEIFFYYLGESSTIYLILTDYNNNNLQYSKIINSVRIPGVVETILRTNGDQLEMISMDKVKYVKTLVIHNIEKDIDVNPIGTIKLRKWDNKNVKFKDGDFINLNGFKIFFKDIPSEINQIQITAKPKEDFLKIINVINIIESPKLMKNIITYKLSDDNTEIILEGKKDPLVFNYTINSSIRNLINNQTFEVFECTSGIFGKWTDITIGYNDSSPIISNWGDYNNILILNPNIDYYIGVKFKLNTNLNDSWDWIQIVEFEAEKEILVIDSFNWVFSEVGQEVLISPQDQYKVYKLTGVKIIAERTNPSKDLEITFRWSDTNGRRWSYWMDLTNANLLAQRIDPLGFFKIEYKVKRIGSEIGDYIILYDIQLQGEFVNISCEYVKSAILGIPPCCTDNMNKDMNCTDTANSANVWANSYTDDSSRWNPYNKNAALQMYIKRTNTVNNLFGWSVDYYKTDTDKNGRDFFMHEDSLFNYIDKQKIKIIVPENQFPDRKVNLTPFDMALLDMFIINISKAEFKKAFGLTYRPSQEDIIRICEINRLFQVEQAYAAYDFLNTGTYYEVVLAKYQHKDSRGGGKAELEKELNELVQFNTLDGVFDTSQKREEDKVSKQTYQPLSREWDREFIHDNVVNIQTIIEAESVIVSKYQYDLTKVPINVIAATYFTTEKPMSKGHNRSWMLWFNLQNSSSISYVLLKGVNWEIGLQGKLLYFKLLDKIWKLDINGITAKVWHAFTVSLNQQTRILKLKVFGFSKNKLNVFYEKKFIRIEPSSFDQYGNPNYELYNDPACPKPPSYSTNLAKISVMGSPIYMTNIRIFNTHIPDDKYLWLLKQYHVVNTEEIIIIDNAQPLQIIPNWSGGNEKQN